MYTPYNPKTCAGSPANGVLKEVLGELEQSAIVCDVIQDSGADRAAADLGSRHHDRITHLCTIPGNRFECSQHFLGDALQHVLVRHLLLTLILRPFGSTPVLALPWIVRTGGSNRSEPAKEPSLAVRPVE